MADTKHNNPLQVWAGIECTINRVKDAYYDQLLYIGHYERTTEDIAALAALGIKTLRYPILWEHHEREQSGVIDWSFATTALNALDQHGISPIVGLVHHGSGPSWASFYDGSFEDGLKNYALQVAMQYPWLEYYTPVNEPVTTARFCGLYGHWYPHRTGTEDFCRILISECKATVMAMEAIRSINPKAKLVQTEDLGKTYSTPLLKYQADYENRRRWLGFELLCGRVNRKHEGWKYLTSAGIAESELHYFLEHSTPPDIIGFNYYATSERYIDEALQHYPHHTHGGNGIHAYADVEAVRVHIDEESGLAPLLRDAWTRYGLPMAITEAHLHCSREHQCRWLQRVWQTCQKLKEEGLDIRAVTAWAAFGAFGWNNLLREPRGLYEPGIFDIRGGKPRPTALAGLVKSLAQNGECSHPVLDGHGWWEQDRRILFRKRNTHTQIVEVPITKRPLLVLGKTGTLGKAFSRVCSERNIPHVLWGRQELDITDEASIARKIAVLNPWAVINATGYVRVEDAEHESSLCFQVNCVGAIALARACADAGIQLLSFSSDLVFDGEKGSAYTESDPVRPLNMYGRSKAAAEAGILHHHPKSAVVRTSAFFSPWDEYNFVHAVLRELSGGKTFTAASDAIVTPTYVPHLVHECLDLLLDEVSGIWHLSNSGAVSWAELAKRVARQAGYSEDTIIVRTQEQLGWSALQPRNSALDSERGVKLPSLDHAMDRYFESIRIGQPNSVLVG
jgi:dTDP-4-dehydrorhamnose reductase